MAGQKRSSLLDVDSTAFLAGLARHVSGLKIDGEKGLARVGLRIQNAAREFAPVDTGRLRSSVQHRMGRDRRGPYVEVGTNVKYAPYVEFGTSRQMAQPYLRPAFAEGLGYYPVEMRRVGGR